MIYLQRPHYFLDTRVRSCPCFCLIQNFFRLKACARKNNSVNTETHLQMKNRRKRKPFSRSTKALSAYTAFCSVNEDRLLPMQPCFIGCHLRRCLGPFPALFDIKYRFYPPVPAETGAMPAVPCGVKKRLLFGSEQTLPNETRDCQTQTRPQGAVKSLRLLSKDLPHLVAKRFKKKSVNAASSSSCDT